MGQIRFKTAKMSEAQNNPSMNLSPQQESDLEKNLVWILASPRSGTTWLAVQLLSYHTHVFGEPMIGEHLASIRDLGGKPVRRIDESKNRADYFFSEKYKNTWKIYLRKLILHRIYAQFPTLEKTIVVKEPNGSFASDIISECLPNSKIIILLRDARDVLLSQTTALSKGGYAAKEDQRWEPLAGRRKLNFIKTMAHRWLVLTDILLKAYNSHSEELRLMIQYENLRKNTLSEMEKIYKFLGIPIEQKKLEAIVSKFTFENLPDEKKGLGTTRQFATPGKWKDSFNLVEKKIIDDILKEKLHELGYQ